MRGKQFFRKPVIISFFLLYIRQNVFFASLSYKTRPEENIGAAPKYFFFQYKENVMASNLISEIVPTY